MDSVFSFTNHALERMESRDISKTRVAQTLFSGQISAEENGLLKAKSWEFTGSRLIRHEVIFSGEEKLIITAWNTSKPFKIRQEKSSGRQASKIYKQRRQAWKKQECDSGCREEYHSCNLRFVA